MISSWRSPSRCETPTLSALRVGDGLAAQTVDGEVNLLPAEKPLVNCVDSDEAGFSDGCLLEDLAQGSTHTIYLRPGDPDGEAQEWSVGSSPIARVSGSACAWSNPERLDLGCGRGDRHL